MVVNSLSQLHKKNIFLYIYTNNAESHKFYAVEGSTTNNENVSPK